MSWIVGGKILQRLSIFRAQFPEYIGIRLCPWINVKGNIREQMLVSRSATGGFLSQI